MKIWNILETEDEVKACLKDREYKVSGVINPPETFTPHAYIDIENYSNGSAVVFIVPLQLTNGVQ